MQLVCGVDDCSFFGVLYYVTVLSQLWLSPTLVVHLRGAMNDVNLAHFHCFQLVRNVDAEQNLTWHVNLLRACLQLFSLNPHKFHDPQHIIFDLRRVLRRSQPGFLSVPAFLQCLLDSLQNCSGIPRRNRKEKNTADFVHTAHHPFLRFNRTHTF